MQAIHGWRTQFGQFTFNLLVGEFHGPTKILTLLPSTVTHFLDRFGEVFLPRRGSNDGRQCVAGHFLAGC